MIFIYPKTTHILPYKLQSQAFGMDTTFIKNTKRIVSTRGGAEDRVVALLTPPANSRTSPTRTYSISHFSPGTYQCA